MTTFPPRLAPYLDERSATHRIASRLHAGGHECYLVGGSLRDAFLDDVTNRLRDKSFRLWPTYAVAGSMVDVVAEKDGRVFGIDLIGY